MDNATLRAPVPSPNPRPIHRTWARRLAVLALTYLALWGTTWLFGRAAVTRFFVSQLESRKDWADDPVEPIMGVKFTGEDLAFRPEPWPAQSRWACLGEPSVPAPFIVSMDVATWPGWAGRILFVWTPWGTYPVHHTRQWFACDGVGPRSPDPEIL